MFDAAKQVLVEEADRIAAELEETLRHALALNDELHALSMLSAQRGGQTLAEGRLQLSGAVHRRLTTPLDWRPMLRGGQTYAERQLPGWQAFFTALQADADAAVNLIQACAFEATITPKMIEAGQKCLDAMLDGAIEAGSGLMCIPGDWAARVYLAMDRTRTAAGPACQTPG